MKNIVILLAWAFIAVGMLSACANDRDIESELQTLEGHVEKSSSLRGTFCNGEGYKWYYEGRYSISGTCMNGMVFHLPLHED